MITCVPASVCIPTSGSNELNHLFLGVPQFPHLEMGILVPVLSHSKVDLEIQGDNRCRGSWEKEKLLLLLVLLLMTYFYSSCQTKLKPSLCVKTSLPSWSLPLTVTSRITTVSRQLLGTRPSTHTHLLSHTEILGAKQEHPVLQIKKLRLILPKFPERRQQSQSLTQVWISQVCPPLWSLVPGLSWGH